MLRRILLLEAAVIMCVFIVELFLREVNYPSDKRYVWSPNLTHTFHPDSSIFYGISGESNFSINALGYRGDLFTDGTKNYLCLGGSTTECLYLDNEETWPYVLQRMLKSTPAGSKTVVGNLGKSGVLAYDNYLHLKHYVPQSKTLNGVIMMIGLNDAMHFLKEPKNQSLTYNDSTDRIRSAQIFSHHCPKNKWWSDYKLLQLAYLTYHQITRPKIDWAVQDSKGETLQRWRENRKSATALFDSLPPHERVLQNYEKVLQLILAEARKQSLEIYFVSQINLYKDSLSAVEQNLLWMGGVGEYQQQAGHAYYTPRAIHQILSEYNQTTTDFCRKHNLPFLDLTLTLPKDTSVFYDDCHFNENGARLVAREVAKFVLSNRSNHDL